MFELGDSGCHSNIWNGPWTHCNSKYLN